MIFQNIRGKNTKKRESERMYMNYKHVLRKKNYILLNSWLDIDVTHFNFE